MTLSVLNIPCDTWFSETEFLTLPKQSRCLGEKKKRVGSINRKVWKENAFKIYFFLYSLCYSVFSQDIIKDYPISICSLLICFMLLLSYVTNTYILRSLTYQFLPQIVIFTKMLILTVKLKYIIRESIFESCFQSKIYSFVFFFDCTKKLIFAATYKWLLIKEHFSYVIFYQNYWNLDVLWIFYACKNI